MKRVISSILAVMLVIFTAPAYSEDYDPQNTMLALNIAIVSVHKIITAHDRVTLD